MTVLHCTGAPCAAGNRAPAARVARRVLHIDGDGGAALLLATLLMPEARVTHAPTLAAATRAIRRKRYQLVVLDPDLPDGDGAALLDALQHVAAPPPVLLYAARDGAWRGAAQATLLKPATSARQLWSALERLLGGGSDGAPAQARP